MQPAPVLGWQIKKDGHVVKRMLINASAAEEVRMAIVEDGVLTDLDVETQSKEKSRGNIYKGIVANVEASLGAAFIEFGHAKQGFLAFDDLRQEMWDPGWQGEGRPRITDVLHRKQEAVVQVIKEEMGNKGAAVTSYLSLPGRYIVLMHSGGGRGGVSRKIDDERERAKAKDFLDKLKVPDGLGVIIRTAGMGKSRAELQKDLNQLTRQWQKIMETAEIARAPSLLYREPDLVVRTIRDYLTSDIDEVIIDDPDEYEEVLDYFAEGEAESTAAGDDAPSTEKKGKDLIKLYQGAVPLFEKYDVEEQIEALYKRQVPLPSGGYLIIDQTEALVSIDVNSGKSTREDDHESTVYKTNLEAVTEVARQLRLRDMGGIVVVDLIDMSSRKHERDVENRFKEATKSDKARIKFSRISENGLMELTRQRLRQAHRLVSHVPCAHCGGTGVVRAVPGQAVAALRELQRRAAAGQGLVARLVARLPVDAANHLANHKRAELDALAKAFEIKVDVLADPTLFTGQSAFDEERRGRAALAAPALPQVKDKEDDWRERRRKRKEERGDRVDVAEPQSIEERQEKSFEADRGRTGRGGGGGGAREPGRDRGRWDRGREGREGREGRGGAEPKEHRSAEKQAQVAAQQDGRPPLVAEDIRGAPPQRRTQVDTGPRHYPDDALMDTLFGDPPALDPETFARPPQPLPGSTPPASAVEGGPNGVPAVAASEEGAVAVVPGAQPAQPVVLGPDGQPLPGAGDGKRRRRRRRRRRGRGAQIDPLTGKPIPQPAGTPGQPGAQGGGEDEEGDDDEEGEEEAPAAAAPSGGVQHELMHAATHIILGTGPAAAPPAHRHAAPAPHHAPAPVELGSHAPVLDADALRAHLDAEDAEEDEGEDVDLDSLDLDEEEADDDGLDPLPPPGPASGDGLATPDAPTVLAKRGRRPSRSSKPKAAAVKKKKVVPKKKPRPSK